MKAFDYVKSLKAGWNLGNTLDASPDEDNADLSMQEIAWGNPFTSEEMIKKVKDAGFDIFRVPVTWCHQVDDDFNINKTWLNRVNEVVDFGIKNGMNVILNLHHENWHFPSNENYPKASKIIKKLWSQISEHFKDYSDKLIFESMNEPRKKGTDVEWNGGDEEGRIVVMKLNEDFVNIVRSSGGNNNTRKLMLPNYAASCEEIAISDFKMPDDENLIVSLHGYVPYEFALSDEHDIAVFTDEHKKAIDNLFTRINKYFISKGIPVIMGECGARKHGDDNESERAKWARYYTSKAREYNIPCVWWDNGIFVGDNKTEIFGLLNREKAEWAYPEIVAAFLGK